ncbi:AI-2E family transporter [Chachezhania antarctica]|uniref:AI-2E family transporter n=1 Tax=Chachezhania antarctica TaxID=2340860 RepID=UPI001F0908B3|nr:AI-2E family transporter [Chachezhania antarctica]
MNTLLVVFLSLASTILVGFLLVVGKAVILPVLIAAIAVYVLHACVDWGRTLPGLRRLPRWVLSITALTIFIAAISLLGLVVMITLEEMVDRSPTYQATLETLVADMAKRFGVEGDPDWQDIREVTVGRINLPSLLTGLFSSLTSFGAVLFLIIFYSGFLMGELAQLPEKIRHAFDKGQDSNRILAIASDINSNIGDYLAVKTAINVLLGTVSFVILWGFGVDFALFWAVMIGLFNYIPYLGSWLGVAFPVILSVAQYGNLWLTLMLTVALTIVQLIIGSVLEPRWIGRQLNLSPFVVMFALALWTSLWGLPGAILAVPLTSALAIIFNAFPATHPITVLLSNAPARAES